MRGTWRFAFLLLIASVLVGGAWAGWQALLFSPITRFEVRTPSDVPPWLKPGPPYVPFRQAQMGQRFFYVEEKWGTFPGAEDLSRSEVWGRLQNFSGIGRLPEPYAHVYFFQLPFEAEIATQGKEGVFVDGVRGWLWRLGPTDFGLGPEDSRLPSETRLEGAVAPNALSSIEKPVVLQVYGGLRQLRQRRTHLSDPPGEAILVQWNKTGGHYVLYGLKRSGVTEEVLLRMANSLVSAREVREPLRLP